MKVKEENDEVGLKLNIQKTNIMASGPNTSWQIDPDGMSLSMLQKLAMDKKAWLAAVHRVTKTQTRLSDWTDVWEDGSLWTHWIHSFHMHVSYLGPILFPCSPCFLHSSSFSAITMGGVAALLDCSWGAHIHIWRPEISNGCDISCLLIWNEIFKFYTLIKSHWQTNLVFVKTNKTFQLCFMEKKIILISYFCTILISCFITITNVAGLNTSGNKKLAL